MTWLAASPTTGSRKNDLSASPDGRSVTDRVQKGDGGEWQVFLRSQGTDGSWWQVAGLPDKCVHAVLGTDALYLLSRRDAPHGKVLRLPVTGGATVAGAHEIVPTSDLVIEDLAVTRDTVWVVDMDSGLQQVRAFDANGRPLAPVEIPPMSSVSSYFARLSTLRQDRIAWSCESFTEPATWWVAADGQAPRATALRTTTRVELSGYEVTREYATSRDGTCVPLNVISAPGTPRDGTAPALLTAYGGYGISLVPRFDPELLLWLSRAASMWWPTSAAAASSARSGTTPVDSPPSRTPSTTSLRARTICTAAGSPVTSDWRSWAVPTEGC